MANIPITDNTTLLNALKAKAQALPAKGSGSTDAPDLSGITVAEEDILAGKKERRLYWRRDYRHYDQP